MVDLKTLEAVVWISRAGSFSAAADRMRTTQPAISLRIQQFERKLGAQLFQRQKPRVLLTEKGREVLRFAEPILRLSGEMIAALTDAAALRGRLSLGVGETIAHSWLPDFLKTMGEAYPGIELDVTVDDASTLRGRLLAFELDLVFLPGAIEDPSICRLPLARAVMGFVAAPALAVPDNVSAADLAQWPIITFSRTSHLRTMLQAVFETPGLPQLKLQTGASLSSIVQMARDGMGLAFLPLQVVREDLGTGRLRLVRPAMAIPDMGFSACWLATPDLAIASRAAEVAAEASRTMRTIEVF